MYNNIIGRWGECLAINYLRKKGYHVLEKNVKLSNQEIDIICLHNGVLIFVEVKTRTSRKLGNADEMISIRKIKDIKRGAGNWLAKNFSQNKIRFDFIALNVDRDSRVVKVIHYKDIV